MEYLNTEGVLSLLGHKKKSIFYWYAWTEEVITVLLQYGALKAAPKSPWRQFH